MYNTSFEKRENESYVVTAEYQVLKLLIEYPEEDFGDTTEYSFPHKSARAIYKAIQVLQASGERVNAGSLFREANKISDSVNAQLIEQVLSYEVDITNIGAAIETLNQGSIKFRLSQSMSKLEEIIASNDPVSAVYITSILSSMQEVAVTGSKKVKSYTLEELLDMYDEELERRMTGNSYQFGDEFLDSVLTRKAAPGQIILLASATGSGKSTICLNLFNGMINLDIPCMYFSLEMDRISTIDRLLALRTTQPLPDWYNKDYIESLRPLLQQEREKIQNKPFRMIDDGGITLYNIQYLIREFKTIYKTDYVCVYIDLITQVREFMDISKGGSLANTIEMAINRLNLIAKQENVCFVCVAQMNRDADSIRLDEPNEANFNKLRPTLNTIKNSHALGERSRVVLSAFRPRYYAERLFPDHEYLETMDDEIEIQILKQSQGRVGTIGRQIFDGPTFRLLPLPERTEETTERILSRATY